MINLYCNLKAETLGAASARFLRSSLLAQNDRDNNLFSSLANSDSARINANSSSVDDDDAGIGTVDDILGHSTDSFNDQLEEWLGALKFKSIKSVIKAVHGDKATKMEQS